jgi:anti-sigma regulatory factor (Ser/Thr protein kinase)
MSGVCMIDTNKAIRVEFEMASFRRRLQQKRREKRTGKREQMLPVSRPHPPAGSRDGEEPGANLAGEGGQALTTETASWRLLATHFIPSEPGNERQAVALVLETIGVFQLPEQRLDQLGTAVAEATMNAMEHGNRYNPDLPVTLQVLASDRSLAVRISDQGGNDQQDAPENYEIPDLVAKLSELQSPRGWGLFLIQHMVDEMHVSRAGNVHTVELILHLEENVQPGVRA